VQIVSFKKNFIYFVPDLSSKDTHIELAINSDVKVHVMSEKITGTQSEEI